MTVRIAKFMVAASWMLSFSCTTFETHRTAATRADKPVLVYTLYYKAKGETRYLPNLDFKDVLDRLRREFDVRVSYDEPTAESLAGVDVLLIASPNDKAVGENTPPHHIASAQIEAISRFVEQGGGLVFLSNQPSEREAHNIEINDSNMLLARFGMTQRNIDIPLKLFRIPEETDLIGGLRFGYYCGLPLDVDPTHPARPRTLVANNMNPEMLVAQPWHQDVEGALIAVAEPGDGRVVVVTETGFLSDWALQNRGAGGGGVVLAPQDNWEIMRRLTRWAAGISR